MNYIGLPKYLPIWKGSSTNKDETIVISSKMKIIVFNWNFSEM